MKKLIFFVIIGFILGSLTAFADDAKVMPARVGRVYVAPVYAFANGAYDDDGKYDEYADGEGAVKVFNLGFALEYGVTDWITAAVQWAPGWTIWSDVDMAGSDVNTNGVYDIFAGAKIQIMGENAPVKSSMFRAAIAPGVKIPLPGPDFKDELKNMTSGDAFTAANADKHVFGFGARGYFDYIINENFYINLYAEAIFYPVKQDLKESSLTGYGTAEAGKAINLSGEVDYGYDLTFEIEPHFDMQIADGISFGAGLPLRFAMTPGVDITYDSDMEAFQPADVDGESTFLFSMTPSASIFITKTLIPLEFKAAYSIPLTGTNTMALNNLQFQIKVYFAIP